MTKKYEKLYIIFTFTIVGVLMSISNRGLKCKYDAIFMGKSRFLLFAIN